MNFDDYAIGAKMTTKTKKTTKKAAKTIVKAKAKMKPAAKTLKKAMPSKAVKSVKSVAKTKAQPKKAIKLVKKVAAPVKKVAKVTKVVKKVVVAAIEAPARKIVATKASTKVVVKPVAAPMTRAARVLAMAAPSNTRPMAPATIITRPAPAQRPVSSMSPVQRQMMQNRPVVTHPANDTPVDFKAGDFVVYPAHGVGTIEGVETQTIAGMTVTLVAITFEKDRMRLKIPVAKAQSSGLRKLCTGDRLKDALKTLQGKAKVKRTMWSRRAQEYEAKINSGDPVQIAEVLRDLRRPKDDTEQSYSERQIYQSALERLAREVAAVQRIAETKAVEQLENVLAEAA